MLSVLKLACEHVESKYDVTAQGASDRLEDFHIFKVATHFRIVN